MFFIVATTVVDTQVKVPLQSRIPNVPITQEDSRVATLFATEYQARLDLEFAALQEREEIQRPQMLTVLDSLELDHQKATAFLTHIQDGCIDVQHVNNPNPFIAFCFIGGVKLSFAFKHSFGAFRQRMLASNPNLTFSTDAGFDTVDMEEDTTHRLIQTGVQKLNVLSKYPLYLIDGNVVKALKRTSDTMNEIKNQLFLQDHPYNVQTLRVHLDPLQALLVMPRYSMDLYEFIFERETGILPENMVRTAIAQLTSILATAHLRGIIHRDIKPENIFLTFAEGGILERVVLADWGLSTNSETEDLQKLTRRVGTKATAAPEVLSNDAEYNYKCDVYSLGVILFVMMYGEFPFQERNITKAIQERKDFDFIKGYIPDYSFQIQMLCKRMLSFDPKERPELVKIFQALTDRSGRVRPELNV
ncbi:MAG: serine/threonine-protein kinase [Alphaproteobacteria bacterium]|nr:MAG: serine/threonine-protein kinase [Alphaproteobacteria bacterium]